MDLFKQSLLDWQLFFTSVATASATLTGLLFVALSLNRQRLKGDKAHPTLSIARNTFSDFLYILMISLVFLVPHPIPLSLTVALLVLGVTSAAGIISREVREYRTSSNLRLDARLLLRTIGLPAIASLGLIIVAVEIALGNFDAVFGLVGVISALLITACWNAWILLVS
jgi:hypothetical protein